MHLVRLRHLPVWCLVFLCFWVVHCSSPPKEEQQREQEQLAREVDEEIEIGRMMAAKLAGHFGLREDPKAIKYLNLIGKTIASQSERQEIEYHFVILKEQDINAFATPGGYIFVTEGLLKNLRSESELAGILGHEIAHVSQKHMYKEIKPKKDVSAGEGISRILSRGRSEMGYSFTQIVNAGMKILLEKGLGPEKEQEADNVGSMYASAIGYEPKALLDYLERIHTNGKNIHIGKTHPPFPARITQLKNFLTQNGLHTAMKADAPVLKIRFEEFLLKFLR